MKNNLSVGIISLGCPRNLVDSESILGRLNNKGYRVTDISKADLAIVNTCAFIEEAKRESIDTILDLVQLKKEGRLKRIIVYGCLAQRYKAELQKELPEVDAFVGRLTLNHERARFPITPKHFAYLKICESCLNHCSFCVIPKLKGKFVSLKKQSILRKMDAFNREGVSEVNIIGQDISGYGLGLYGKVRLAELLRKLASKAGNIGWIRLLYLYPSRITEDLLKTIADSPKICKYIDLPLQHCNDRILKLMNRKTTKTDIFKLIEKIRKIVPKVALRTSIITGFPSETEDEFKELLSFIETVRFERLGAFVYSREEGTRAYLLPQQIPTSLKRQRLGQIMTLQQKISEGINAGFLGKTMQVLIDEVEDGRYIGRSQYDAPEVDGVVYVSSKRRLKPGDFVNVTITDTLEYDLVGEVAR